MKTALAFSGGKDSWACLWLMEQFLPEMPVLWVNTGKNFPEVLSLVEKARKMCPQFIEIPSDRERQNSTWGLPSDVVPIDWTRLGHSVTGAKKVMIQSYLQCCGENISTPLHRKAMELGIERLISGQREDEGFKAPYSSGAIVDGIEQVFPLEKWTREDVLRYLETKMEIPPHFRFAQTSLDCFDCTACRGAYLDRTSWMREKHPELFLIYQKRAMLVDLALMEALSNG